MKIDLFVNGKYVSSSNRYRTCRQFVKNVREYGFINWQGLQGMNMRLQESDKVSARIDRSK